MKKASRKTVNLTVVMDSDANECLYIDGHAWKGTGEMTVYACDLVDAAKGRLIRLEHISLEFWHEHWPAELEDALKEPAGV
jgi:hypothetical protein